MPWAKLDDQFHAHPKLAGLGKSLLEGVGLYCLALSWSCAFLTDGRIPDGQVERLGGTVKLAAALVAAGLWERGEGEYIIHDFLKYNPSRATHEAERAVKAGAGKLGGLRSGEVRRGSHEPDAKQTPKQTPKQTTDDSEAEAAPEPTGERTPTVHEQGPLNSRLEGRRNPTQTPVPEPGPTPEPETGAPSPKREKPLSARGDGDRSVLDALRERLGRVTPGQRRVVAEIVDRHDVSGPEWSAMVIRQTPIGEEPLAALMKADSAWQAERRARTAAEEQTWARQKTEDRAAAAANLARLGWTDPIEGRRGRQDVTNGA